MTFSSDIINKLLSDKWVGNIDLSANDQADANIIVDKEAGWSEQESAILDQLQGLLNTNQLDAVICVAGKPYKKMKFKPANWKLCFN